MSETNEFYDKLNEEIQIEQYREKLEWYNVPKRINLKNADFSIDFYTTKEMLRYIRYISQDEVHDNIFYYFNENFIASFLKLLEDNKENEDCDITKMHNIVHNEATFLDIVCELFNYNDNECINFNEVKDIIAFSELLQKTEQIINLHILFPKGDKRDKEFALKIIFRLTCYLLYLCNQGLYNYNIFFAIAFLQLHIVLSESFRINGNERMADYIKYCKEKNIDIELLLL